MVRLLRAAATLVLVTAGIVVGVSGPAQAACTNHDWTNPDDTMGTAKAGSYLRSGPHDYCSIEAYGSWNLWYHCYTFNEAGNTWTHARIDNTSRQGWIWDGNLKDGGSTRPC